MKNPGACVQNAAPLLNLYFISASAEEPSDRDLFVYALDERDALGFWIAWMEREGLIEVGSADTGTPNYDLYLVPQGVTVPGPVEWQQIEDMVGTGTPDRVVLISASWIEP